MKWLDVRTLQKFKNTIEFILHVTGNYRGGILEMTIVADNNLSKRVLKELLPELLNVLKHQSDIFRNVRFNFAVWKKDDFVENKVCSMMSAMLSDFYNNYEQVVNKKCLEELIKNLKVFHARSKIIIFLSDGLYYIKNREILDAEMKPFLDKKLMFVNINDNDNIEIFYKEIPTCSDCLL